MRFLSTLATDIRYQVKYGFYLLYAFISVLYTAVMLVCPHEYKGMVASIVILTDPSMLGMFFIGGIWLLETEEGLHKFWEISPLRPIEYILSKSVSLAVISTLSTDIIVLIGLHEARNYFLLSLSVLTGSMIFTLIGLLTATYARSVNHYLLISSLPGIVFMAPPILAAFGISHPFFDLFPGSALWRMISYYLGVTDKIQIWLWLVLVLWLVIALLVTNKRIPAAMQHQGGEKT